MSEGETRAEEAERQWIFAVRVELQGPKASSARGSSRHVRRGLSEAEMDALNTRLRAAAGAFLAEIDALEAEDGWAEAQADGSWVWREGS